MQLICFLSTGTDEKNLVGLRSYPIEVQEIIKKNEKYKNKIKSINLIMFVIVLFVFGIFIKSEEILNLFDLIVIGLIWWRNTKRIRFKDIPEKTIPKS